MGGRSPGPPAPLAPLGPLVAGAAADVALLELREGTFEFVDNFGGKRTGHQRLFPVATVIGGKRAPPRV